MSMKEILRLACSGAYDEYKAAEQDRNEYRSAFGCDSEYLRDREDVNFRKWIDITSQWMACAE